MSDNKTRVVVTGLGVISGCGIGHDDFFQACLDGKSSLDRVKRFDISNYPCQIASEVPEEMFVATDYFINPKNARSNDRFTHFAVAAARLALKDAGVGDTPETLQNPERIGVMVGSAFGGMETFEQETLKLAAKPERPKVRLDTNILYTRVLYEFRQISLFHSICTSKNKHRYHPLPFPLSWATQHLVWLLLRRAHRAQTTELCQRVPVPVMPLARPWE
jgi:hypothetical protein